MRYNGSTQIEIEEQGYKHIDKYICADCLKNEYLKSWLENHEQAEVMECDYCGKETLCIPMDTYVEKFLEAIHFYYIENDKSDNPWDSEEKEFLYKVSSLYEVLGDFVELYHYAPLDDLLTHIHCDGWCKKDPLSLTENERKMYSWQRFSDIVKYHNRYCFYTDMGDKHNEYYSAQDILSTFAEDVKNPNLNLIKTIPAGTSFYRARNVNKEDLKNLTDSTLGAPPCDKAAANRMSAEGISVFYCADKVNTAVKEIISGVYQNIVIAEFKNKKELKYLDLSSIKKLKLFDIFDTANHDLRELILFYNALNNELSKTIKDIEKLEYVPTQIFAEYFNIIEGLDGIKYISAKDKNSDCIVLFFDNEQCTNKTDPILCTNKCVLEMVNYKILKKSEVKNLLES